jgi:hypothetical protein
MKSRAIGAGLLAALLGFAGSTALILAPSSPVILVFVFVVLPLIGWSIFLRKFRAAFLFTTIGELYSGSSGTWFAVGPLSIRWILILGTLCAFVLIGVVKWPPLNPKERVSWPPYTILALAFGAVFPVLLFALTAAFTNNPLADAAQSLGFMFTFLLYFPLRKCFRDHWDELIGLLLGLSCSLWSVMLLMSIGPVSSRQTITRNIVGDFHVGTTVTGISRAMPVHIVLLLFPACLAMVAMARPGSVLRKAGLIFAALASLLPLIVTFLIGPVIGFMLTMLGFGLLLLSVRRTRRQGLVLMSSVAAFVVIVIGIASVLTPDLLEEKLFLRLNGIAAGGTSLDPRRDLQWSTAADDLQLHRWLGNGAGAPMPNPVGGEDPRVEMEGLLIFHRYGALGSVPFLVGILGFALHPFIWFRKTSALRGPAATTLALWAAGCAIIQCGMWNPYFSTPFPALFVALYLCSFERQKNCAPQVFLSTSGERDRKKSVPSFNDLNFGKPSQSWKAS